MVNERVSEIEFSSLKSLQCYCYRCVKLTSSHSFIAVFEWEYRKSNPEFMCCLLHRKASSCMWFFVTQTPFVIGRSLSDGDVWHYCSQLRLPETKYHRPSGLSNRKLFVVVLRLGSPRSRCQLIWFLVKAVFPACKWPPFGCVLICGKRLSQISDGSYKDTNRRESGSHPYDLIKRKKEPLFFKLFILIGG